MPLHISTPSQNDGIRASNSKLSVVKIRIPFYAYFIADFIVCKSIINIVRIVTNVKGSSFADINIL